MLFSRERHIRSFKILSRGRIFGLHLRLSEGDQHFGKVIRFCSILDLVLTDLVDWSLKVCLKEAARWRGAVFVVGLLSETAVVWPRSDVRDNGCMAKV